MPPRLRKENDMKYTKRMKPDGRVCEVSYEEALHSVLGTYNDTEEVRSMLTIGNFIPCAYADIRVYDDNGLTAAPGLMCLIP